MIIVLKAELIDVIDVCPIPGWSVMLIKVYNTSQEGEASNGERKQLEINSAPMTIWKH